jgi:hypothetical protein
MRKRTKKKGGANALKEFVSSEGAKDIKKSFKEAVKESVISAVSSDQTCNFDRIDAYPNQNTQKVREEVLRSKFISKDKNDFGAFLQNQMKVLCDKEEKDISNPKKIRKRRLNLCENMLKCIKSPRELIYVLYDIFNKESQEPVIREKNSMTNEEKKKAKEAAEDAEDAEEDDDNDVSSGGGKQYGGADDDDDDDDDDEEDVVPIKKSFVERNIVSFVTFFCNILVVSLKNYYDKKKSDDDNFTVASINILTDLNTELRKIFTNIEPILSPDGTVNKMFIYMDDNDIQTKPHPFYTLILNEKDNINKKFEERMKKEASGEYAKEIEAEDIESDDVSNSSMFGGIVMFFLGMAFLIEYSGFKPKK